MLQKLKEYELPKNLYLLLRTILNQRTINYKLIATEITINSPIGSPQGSPLSPLIWNIFIATLLDLKFEEGTYIQAFADDITIIIRGKNRLEIEQRANKTLATIDNWSKEKKVNLNKTKCQCITIGKEYKRRPPQVKFGDKNLKHTKELKILGVIFDRNLAFTQHANYLKSKIYQNTTKLATFAGIKWGIKPRQFRDIYIKSIERTIVYAAAVYWKSINNSHLLRKMTSVQRIPLIKIVKAYRTVSNKSLNILANIKPIELTLNKEVAAFNIFQNKKDYTIGGKQYKKKRNPTSHRGMEDAPGKIGGLLIPKK